MFRTKERNNNINVSLYFSAQ